jgi:hypothetical protein
VLYLVAEGVELDVEAVAYIGDLDTLATMPRTSSPDMVSLGALQ